MSEPVRKLALRATVYLSFDCSPESLEPQDITDWLHRMISTEPCEGHYAKVLIGSIRQQSVVRKVSNDK